MVKFERDLCVRRMFLGILAIISLTLFGTYDVAYASVPGAPVYIQYMDNDNNQIDSPLNGYKYTWTRGSYYNDYRGDHRISYTYGAEYQWQFSFYSSRTRQYYAYLRHPNFNNPFAEYNLWTSNSFTMSGWIEDVDTINQNTAYPGWNALGGNRVYPLDSRYFRVASYYTQYGTGADGAMVEFYNN